MNEITNRSSMLYWWPRIKDLPIPQPKTVVVSVPTLTLLSFADGDVEPFEAFVPQLKIAGGKVRYPLFLRTDVLSNKHDWENSCYVDREQDLLRHIESLVEANFAIFGPPAPSALVFREYIPLASRFTAFWGNLPIAPERRYFVRDGAVQCSHPYWPSSAIEDASVPNWRELLAEMNQRRASHTGFLGFYARKVGKALGGYWSVDFALAADDRWLLIDCAEGEKSYHWKECEYANDG